MEDILKPIGAIVVVILVFIGASLLMGYPVMWIVNYLFTPAALTSVFGIPALTFWKAFWLSFLCSTLFKNGTSITKEK